MKTKIVVGTIALVAVSAAALMAVPVFAKGQGHGQMGGQGDRPSFETLDTDGDGSITIVEIKARAVEKFAQQDTNGDGILTVEELTTAMLERARTHTEEKIERMISWRDTDGDGALSQAELGGGMGERMFNRLDANKDGAISEEEFEVASERGHGKKMGGHGGQHSDG